MGGSNSLAADDRAIVLKMRDVVEATVSESTVRQVAMRLLKTRDIRLTGDPVKTVEVLVNRYTLNDTERAGVLRNLIDVSSADARGPLGRVDGTMSVDVLGRTGCDTPSWQKSAHW
jgi:hypothetical protein